MVSISRSSLLSYAKAFGWLLATASLFFVGSAFATDSGGSGDAAGSQSIAWVAQNVTSTMSDLAKVVTATAFVAGMGFAVGAILKFKAHKDNPTQIPVGTPIALLFISAALIFLPNIFTTVGQTLFGSDPESGTIAGTDTVGGSSSSSSSSTTN